MKAERKKEIRSLVHTVPLLIKAHMVNQAFDTEKVIMATFELSEPFLDLLGGKIPPNHIDRIQEVYGDIMYKAFNVGIKTGEVKSKSTEVNTALTGEDLDREIEIKIPMYFGIKKDLIALFTEQLGDILTSVPDLKEDIVTQFNRDMDRSYLDGVKEYLNLNNTETLEPTEVPEAAPSPIEEEMEEEEEEEDEEVDVEDIDEEIEDLEEKEDDMEEDLDNLEEEEEEEEEEVEDDIEDEDELEEEKEEKEVKSSFKANASLNDATAITALKVWDKYATNELKEIFKVQTKMNRHTDNAQMVYAFNNWLVKGNTPDLFIPGEMSTRKPEDKAVLKRLEEYARLLKDSTAEKVLRYTLGLPVKKAQGALENSTVNKLEAYTKLLKDPEAEQVLRCALGLPFKKVTASVDRFIGPYDTKSLKEKIVSIVKNPQNKKVAEAGMDGVETIVVDCIVAKMNHLTERLAVKRVCSKLGVKANNFEELEKETITLARNLDEELKLPGDCVFIDVNGDYCLTYSYAAVDQGVTHTLPRNHQGVLNMEDQKQIASLSRLSKSKTIKDISKASFKVAAYLKKVLSDIRWGRVGVVEGGNKLKASLEDIVAEVFGLDGLGYYQYLRDKR